MGCVPKCSPLRGAEFSFLLFISGPFSNLSTHPSILSVDFLLFGNSEQPLIVRGVKRLYLSHKVRIA